MTNLTEQWEKGELPSGMYFIEFKDGDISKDVYAFGSWGNINEHFLKQVLAEVPSYEEWQAKLEENTKLKERIEKDNKWYSDSIHIKVERIEILENILKEVRGKLHYINTPQNRHNIFGNDLMKKLDQVLGE